MRKKLITSQRGKTWKGELLTEENLYGRLKVKYHGQIYRTGNRRLGMVELYNHGTFIRMVRISQIYLLKTITVDK